MATGGESTGLLLLLLLFNEIHLFTVYSKVISIRQTSNSIFKLYALASIDIFGI